MKAVTVRELGNDPSTVLREARTDPVIVLGRDRPEAVLIHLSDDSLLGEQGIRLAIATALYRSESVSLGRAAEISRLPVADFMQHVSRLGIPVVRGDAATLRELAPYGSAAACVSRPAAAMPAGGRRSEAPKPG